MKRISWRIGLAAACGALTLFGPGTPLRAAEDNPAGSAERLERLERRVNEIAQRQEQLIRHLEGQQERQAPMPAPGREGFRAPRGGRGGAGFGQLPTLPGAPAPVGMAPQTEPPVCPMKCCRDIAGFLKLCLLVGIIFNILLAIWIYTDIRKRGEGSGIFVALALLAGIPTAIIYSLVRIGDKKP